MALVLPGGDAPQSFNQAKITLAFALDYTVATGSYNLPVPAGYYVEDVSTVVTTAFDGTPAITIGDSTTAAGYLTSANVALATAATASTPAVKRSSGIANTYQFGKRYSTADNIVIAWTQGTSPTTGVLKGFYTLVPLPDLGVAASATAV